MDDNQNIAETVEKLTRQADGLKVVYVKPEVSCVPYVLVPAGFQVQEVPDLRAYPLRKKGNVQLANLASFINYVNKFKTNVTEVFEVNENRYRAVFNWDAPPDQNPNPAWCDDSASFAPTITAEWEAWTKNDGKLVSQADFIEFIESNSLSFTSPSTAAMLEVARYLEIHQNVDFKSAVTLENGDVSLNYSEQTDARMVDGQKTFPSNIVLALQLHRDGPRYEVNARFRYQILNRKANFVYRLRRPDLIVQDAYKGMTEQIAKETGLKVWKQ